MDGQNFNNVDETNVQQEAVQQEPVQDNFYQTNIDSTPVYSQTVETAPQKDKNDAMSIVSLVLGILSILCCCCYGGGLVLAIPGLICAIIAKKKVQSGLLTAGFICSIVGIVLNVLMLIGVIISLVLGVSNYGYYY